VIFNGIQGGIWLETLLVSHLCLLPILHDVRLTIRITNQVCQ
jgi:hypothetical protein